MKVFRYVFPALLLTSLYAYSGSETVYHGNSTAENAHLISSDKNSVILEFNLPDLAIEKDYLFEFGYGSRFRIPTGGGVNGEIGKPDVPIIWRYVKVPNKGRIEVEVISEKTQILGKYKVLPYQKPPTICEDVSPYVIDANVYNQSEYYPNFSIKIVSIEILRDIRAARLWFYPVRVNPVTQEVTVVTNVKVKLNFTNEKGERELNRKYNQITRTFIPIYKKVLNFDKELLTTNRQEDVGCYMFMGSSTTLEAVEDFINWKKRKGYDVVVVDVDTVGSDASTVDSWLEDSYNNWPNSVEYFFIIGSDKVVPAPYSRGARDHVYGCVTNDRVPDIHVGRITGKDDETANLTYQTWKIRMHEMEPYEEGDWFNKAETFGCDGLNGNQTADRWANTLKDGGLETEAYYEGGLNGSGLAEHFNDGLSLWGYKGHGNQTYMSSVGFSVSTVQNSLDNGRKLPFISSIGCNNGEYDRYYCITEALMCEGSIDNPKGALGMLSGTVSMGMTMEDLIEYLWIGMFEEGIWHVSAAETYAKSEVNSSSSDVVHSMIWGDPEVAPYTVVPLPQLEAEHLIDGKGVFNIKVTDGTSPVEGALVGVVKKVNYDHLGSGFTDASGELTLDLPDYSGDVYITVTYHNCKPYLYEGPTGIDTQNYNKISKFALGKAYPNPFQNSTAIKYSLPRAGKVQFDVFNMNGSKIYSVTLGKVKAGSHTLTWDGTSNSGKIIPNGVYLYKITSDCGTKVRTCSVMR